MRAAADWIKQLIRAARLGEGRMMPEPEGLVAGGAAVSAPVMRIVPAGSERDAYLPLLRLADDSEAQVRGYYQQGDLYALDDATRGPAGIVLAVPAPDGAVELKAVAV